MLSYPHPKGTDLKPGSVTTMKVDYETDLAKQVSDLRDERTRIRAEVERLRDECQERMDDIGRGHESRLAAVHKKNAYNRVLSLLDQDGEGVRG